MSIYKKLNHLVVIFFLLFVLTFLEQYKFLSIGFGPLWKLAISVLFFLTWIKSMRPVPIINKLGFLFCFLIFINTSFLVYIKTDIFEFFRYLVLPLSIGFFFNKKFNKEDINKFLVLFCMSLVLINIPVFLGIIDVNYEQKDFYLTYKVTEAKSIGFKGLYDNPHNFSIYNSLSFLVILNNVAYKRYKSLLWFQILILLIALYFSYLSFVRTGWVIIMVGAIYVYLKHFKNVSKLKKLALVVFIPLVIVLLYFQVSQSKLLLMRLFDQTAYNKNVGFETQGAGRLFFSYQALINWLNDGFLSIIFGYGLEKGKLLLDKTIGYNLVSHNGVVDVLQSTGLLGLGVFSLYIKKIYFKVSKYVSDLKTRDDFILIFITFLVAGVLQSFTYPYILFLLGLSFYNATYNSIRS